ncbi:MAG: Maf family protein [Candidatus Marinimicrobia bacterium]|nr:Maf family protein [Candidatus Neomarinimicrobiota bacterium]MCF7850106.1 Maf family protein [Candidatus Neomarinimicrobiota bacterium]MCF7905081.1 Maf family protein [Candidatus Neomarinimicrobiota bacterium]
MKSVRLVLASASPRRKVLLEQIGLTFEVHPSHIPEPPLVDQNPASYAEELARAKAIEISQQFPERLVVGADTIVVVDETVLGKPVDDQAAFDMLSLLSNRSHQVITAYSIQLQKEHLEHTTHVMTEVHFKDLSQAEKIQYIQSGAAIDKAGSYGIQDYSGVFVDKINGCFYNVVGLPLSHFNSTLQSLLQAHGLELAH